MGLKRIRVAAGLVTEGEKILVARRKTGRTLAGHWEFPGGKIEPGETPEEALARELREELGIEVAVGAYLGRNVHAYPELEVELLGYWARRVAGELALRDHDEVRWVDAEELSSFRLSPADIPFLPLILSQKGR